MSSAPGKGRIWHGLCLAGFLLIIGPIAVWAATGREGFTRWPNAKLSASDTPAASGEDDLLAEIGFETGSDTTPTPEIESRFALGLAPSGADPKHMVSVATGLAGGLAMLLAGFIIPRIQRRTRE